MTTDPLLNEIQHPNLLSTAQNNPDRVEAGPAQHCLTEFATVLGEGLDLKSMQLQTPAD